MAGFTLFGPTHHMVALSLRLGAVRHELLTANIANADTPGYRPKDFDFASVLRALSAPEEPSSATQGGRIQLVAAEPVDFSLSGGVGKLEGWQAFQSSGLLPSLPIRHEGQDKLDRNSVNLDREIGLLVENSLLYETNLTLLSRMLAGLRYAISEGRR